MTFCFLKNGPAHEILKTYRIVNKTQMPKRCWPEPSLHAHAKTGVNKGACQNQYLLQN